MRMSRSLAVVAVCLAVGGCGGSSDKGPGTTSTLSVHQFAPAERSALAASLSRSLPNSGAAQFKWMPVLVAGKGRPAQYCGLVSVGGQFREFAALLGQDSSGVFNQGTIQHIAGGAGGVSDAPDGGTAALCREWGYSDFALAN